MNVIFSILFTIVFFSANTCVAQQANVKQQIDDGKTLVVYLSRTNNTKAVAKIIHAKVGDDLVALELQNPYPENYRATVEQVAKENETGFLPPLRTKIENFSRYDTIFIGFPTWGMQLPPPGKSFLSRYDFNGKTIVPFNTHAGYGPGSSFTDIKRYAPDAEVLEGLSVKGGIERDGILFVMEGEKRRETENLIENWLSKIGINK